MHECINSNWNVRKLQRQRTTLLYERLPNFKDKSKFLELSTGNQKLCEGKDLIKDAAMGEIKQYFDNKYFKKKDVVAIFANTTKEDELFDYVGHHRYYGVPKYNELDDDYEYNKNKDDDFEMTL